MTSYLNSWTMKKPDLTTEECFQHCWSSGKNEDRRLRLENYTYCVLAAEMEFKRHSANAILYKITRPCPFLNSNFIKDMIWSYEKRFVCGPGADLYNKLRASIAHCPLCGGDTSVSTLDHHLPKSVYPALAVTPLNLVPSCSICNNIKKVSAPQIAAEQSLNPYFDNVDDLLWLHAELDETSPPKISFRAEPCDQIPAVLSQKIITHFKIFELARRFENHVPAFLSSIMPLLSKQFRAAGSGGLRNEVLTIADGYPLNSWQNAACQVLAKSDWYCEGGFIL